MQGSIPPSLSGARAGLKAAASFYALLAPCLKKFSSESTHATALSSSIFLSFQAPSFGTGQIRSTHRQAAITGARRPLPFFMCTFLSSSSLPDR